MILTPRAFWGLICESSGGHFTPELNRPVGWKTCHALAVCWKSGSRCYSHGESDSRVRKEAPVARQDKKERKRLKRKQKQLKLRRDRGMSVYQRLARMPGEMQCTITRGWKEIGEGNLIVSRDAPGGGKVVLAFLIDFWCVGLKDAFGREGLTSAEIASFRERTDGVPILE